jgi:hypothetical protein
MYAYANSTHLHVVSGEHRQFRMMMMMMMVLMMQGMMAMPRSNSINRKAMQLSVERSSQLPVYPIDRSIDLLKEYQGDDRRIRACGALESPTFQYAFLSFFLSFFLSVRQKRD